MSADKEDREYLMQIAQWMEDTTPEQWMKDSPKTRERLVSASVVRQIARRIFPIPSEDEVTFVNGTEAKT